MVILGVAAHPDDLDFGASGTFAKWVKMGYSCYYLICTDGSRGSDEPGMTEGRLAQIRKTEQQEAGRVLCLKDIFLLNYKDIELVANLEIKKKIVEYIRTLKPDIVVTTDPNFLYSSKTGFINHSDHRAAGLATMDAVYPLARDRLTFKDFLKKGLNPHKVGKLYFISFDDPTDVIDITETMELKLQAIGAHKSQINKDTLAMVRDRAKKLGEKKGYKFGEGFCVLSVL